MWQQLYRELHAQNFTIVAVAFDSREGAAKPWIDEAQPDYPVLVDPFHYVADLYNMANVNLGVWIDEAGTIVRPTESAGTTEGFRKMDRATGKVPDDVMQVGAEVKETYHNALRDWVANGASSTFALNADAARERLVLPSADTQRAHPSFALGQYLINLGRNDEGDECVNEASRLHPQSWAIWRQGAELLPNGLAAAGGFWERVDALGDEKYYEVIDMPGMPSMPA
ncbi:MAG: hypothetical protein ACI8PT_004406 [Gammaproteobacteria bacterium]